MRVPKKVIISGHTFEIIYKKKLFCNNVDCWGMCDYKNHKIYLVRGLKPTHKMEIFLHECIHAIEDIHLIKLPEVAVKNMAIGILGLIRNNKIDFLKD